MVRIFIAIFVIAQAAALFAAGMLFAYQQNGPATIALAIGAAILVLELISLPAIRVEKTK